MSLRRQPLLCLFATWMLLFASVEVSSVAWGQGCFCEETTKCPRDIWMIETQDVCTCECDLSKLKFKRLGDDCEWIVESEESFLTTLDPSKPINFQLPGYLTDHQKAVDHLGMLQRALDKQAECKGLGCANVRLVMWKWPAEKDQIGWFRDLREKAARAHFEGMLLAKLLVKFPKEMRVHFLAYSFGARIATSAAHHLVLEEAKVDPQGTSTAKLQLRGVLIAPAVDAAWLEHCQPHAYALQRFEKVLVFTNCMDRLLRRYRVVNRNRRSPALGLVGLLGSSAEWAGHVTQLDVTDIIGRDHDWHHYIEAPQLMPKIAEYVLWLN